MKSNKTLKQYDFKKLKEIANGEDSPVKTALANALLIESIKRKPLSFGKCCAVLELINDKK